MAFWFVALTKFPVAATAACYGLKWPPFIEQLGNEFRVMKWSAPLYSHGLEGQNERGFRHNEADEE